MLSPRKVPCSARDWLTSNPVPFTFSVTTSLSESMPVIPFFPAGRFLFVFPIPLPRFVLFFFQTLDVGPLFPSQRHVRSASSRFLRSSPLTTPPVHLSAFLRAVSSGPVDRLRKNPVCP